MGRKHLSEQSVDSGIHGVSRRPHMTRRALKANLRKSSSRRSGTDYLSRSAVVFDVLKDYPIREDGSQAAGPQVSSDRPDRRRRGRKPKASQLATEDPSPTTFSASNVIPISI